MDEAPTAIQLNRWHCSSKRICTHTVLPAWSKLYIIPRCMCSRHNLMYNNSGSRREGAEFILFCWTNKSIMGQWFCTIPCLPQWWNGTKMEQTTMKLSFIRCYHVCTIIRILLGLHTLLICFFVHSTQFCRCSELDINADICNCALQMACRLAFCGGEGGRSGSYNAIHWVVPLDRCHRNI